MTINQPPRFAGRLLKPLVPAQNHDSLRSQSFAVVTELEYVLSAVMIGWLIVRLHRGHGVAPLLAYCCLVVVLRIGNLVQLALLPVPSWHLRDLSYALANGQIREWLLLILGGYLATRQPETV